MEIVVRCNNYAITANFTLLASEFEQLGFLTPYQYKYRVM